MSDYIYFTKYTSDQNPVTKIFWIEDGGIKKELTNSLFKGVAKRIKMKFDDFENALNKATTRQTFGYGLHDRSFPDKVNIVVDGKEIPTDNVLSKTKKFFKYRQLPGILMIDHDPDDYGQQFTAKELISVLSTIDPEIENAAMMIRGSASAGVHVKGTEPTKSKGFHIYIPVKDASTIPEYGKLLYEHLWLKGYGYAKPSINGKPLFRTAIDDAVFSAERIDIVGKPILVDDDLEYRPPIIKVKKGYFLDTSKLKELTSDEVEKVTNLKSIAKEKIKPLARKIKSEWKKNKVPEVSKSMSITKEAAKKLVDDFLKDDSKLYGDWPLYFDNGDVVSVIELLKNPNKYDGLSLADPLDGINKIRKGKAMFWWNNGSPIIHSFAHGENKNYFLSESKNKLYIEGVKPHYENPEYITKEEAQTKMRKIIKKWMNSGDEHFAIAAPAGIGKTMMIAEEVAKYANDHLVEIYVPTHKLGNEIGDKILAKNNKLKITVIRGRTYFDKDKTDDKPFCKKHNLIETIESYGYNIYQDVCMTCPFESGELMCDYLKQFSNETQVRIYNHKYLPVARKLDQNLPAKAIIDERFFTDLIEIKQTKLRHIEHFISNEFGLSDVICNVLEFNEPLLARLKTKYPENLRNVINNAKNKLSENTLPEIDANTDYDLIKNKLKSKKVKITRLLSTMLDQIMSEIELFPEREHSITVRKIEKAIVIVKRLEIKRFQNKDSNTPVLCIDADYSQQIARLFLPGITNIKVNVRRLAEVFQIFSTTNAKIRFIPHKNAINIEKEIETTKEYIKKTQRILDNIYADYGSFLVVSYQALVGNKKNNIPSLLNLPKDCDSIHFGGLRGIDTLKHFDTVVVIGRNQLSVDALESQAAALWWDSNKELILTGERSYELRGFRVRNGKEIGVNVMVCKDKRSQLIQELQRECETLQGIDRLRLIHTETKKNVFLLCNLPLDITVDKLIHQKKLFKWKSNIEKALLRDANKILPLSSIYLREKHPDLFSSTSKANREIANEGLSETIEYIKSTKKSLIFNDTPYHLYGYRLLDEYGIGRQGKHQKVLAPVSMTDTKVKKHLKNIFKKNIEIIQSTIRGLDDIVPIPSENDHYQDEYDRSKKYYNSELNIYYIVIDE